MTSRLLYVTDYDNRCPLQKLIKKVYDDFKYEFNEKYGLGVRIFKVGYIDGKICHWVRVSGNIKLVKAFRGKLRYGDYIMAIDSKYGFIGLICFNIESSCDKCIYLHNNPSILVKTHIITKDVKISEVISSSKKNIKELKKIGYEVIGNKIPSELNYILTPKQDEVLYNAYINGYFDYPRKIKTNELADKLNLSISATHESLRKAIKKVADAYIKHNFPHYIAGKWIEILKIKNKEKTLVKDL